MKKLVSILLSVLMIVSSISCLFTVSAAETDANLFTNGDFATCDTEANTVTDWYIASGNYTADVVEGTDENLPEGEKFNFVTFNKGSATGTATIYNYQSIKLNTNTGYTFSFWIKTNGDAKGMKFFLYEPKYVKRDGTYGSNNGPAEATNIYTYTYDNGSTRVARTEINHVMTDSRDGFIRKNDSSMASFQNTAYPSTEGEWVKVTHTFTTGNDEYHVANVRYGITIPETCEAEYVALGGFEAYATPLNATIVQGSSNDYDLGTVEPRNGALVTDGKATLTAVPFGTNKFVGWFNGDELVSSNKEYTFTYDSTAEYKAVFEAYGDGIADSNESYTTTLATWVDGAIDNSGSNGAWVLDSTDGSTWTKVNLNTKSAYARSGSKSVNLYSRYAFAGRNFTGLKTNTDYTLTFYSYMEVGTGMNTEKLTMHEFDRRIERAFVTDSDTNIAWTASEGTTGSSGAIANTDSAVLGYYNGIIYGTGRWEKTTITFNSGNSTDVTLWLRFVASTVKGQNTDGCYIDDISLAPVAEEEEDDGENTVMNFEDVSKWERYVHGTENISGGPLASDEYTWYTITANTTETKYIKDGNASVKIKPQAQYSLIKLENLKPDTDYMLKFSYSSNAMKNSDGTAKKSILNNCGVWNYAADGAKFKVSSTASNGYLHSSLHVGAYFDAFFAADGTYTSDYKSRKISEQQADTWYEKVLLFNTGDVYKTLALVIVLEVNCAYFDDFCLIECGDEAAETDFAAPAISGKTSTGSYDTDTATTTLYQSCEEADYTGYLTTLKNNYFTEYATNTIGSNKFATYTKGNTTVNVEYTPATKTILVTEQVTDALPTKAKDNEYTDLGYQPLIIQLDHNGATGGGIGMSYIIRLADGSFIMVDGGHTESKFDNADRMYNLLRQYIPTGEIKIAAWILTHCHSDHISGFMSFIEKYNAEINVEQVIYNFGTEEQYAKTGNDVGKINYTGFTVMKAYMASFIPEARVSTCHSGYKYSIRNAVVDIYFTMEDIFPSVLGTNYTDINNTSTTFKVSFTDENVDQTLLITGDSANTQCTAMAKKYPGEELKSTFVQVIHHGISYGYYSLYALMDPEVALFPASSNRLMNVLYQAQNRYFVEEDSVKEVALSDYGTRVFALPYTAPEGLTGMGKFTLPSDTEVMNTLNSYVGVSIRQAGEKNADIKQALRFKFQIPTEIIKAHTEDGYTVAEYGMMASSAEKYAANSAVLDYYAGTAETNTLSDGTKQIKGIAYDTSTGKNKVFDYVNYKDLDDGVSRSVQYTAALYNIGVKGDITDYAKYDAQYAVRPYIVFKNSAGETKIYYGTIQYAGVFDVMEAILSSTATDDQTVSDQTYVKNFLDGKINGYTDDAAKIAEAWNADADRAALYTPAN